MEQNPKNALRVCMDICGDKFKVRHLRMAFCFSPATGPIGSHSEICKQATTWVNITFLVKQETTETLRAGEDSPLGKRRQMSETWQVVNKTTPTSLKSLFMPNL